MQLVDIELEGRAELVEAALLSGVVAGLLAQFTGDGELLPKEIVQTGGCGGILGDLVEIEIGMSLGNIGAQDIQQAADMIGAKDQVAAALHAVDEDEGDDAGGGEKHSGKNERAKSPDGKTEDVMLCVFRRCGGGHSILSGWEEEEARVESYPLYNTVLPLRGMPISSQEISLAVITCDHSP